MIRGDERYLANMVLYVIEHVECPMLMYEGEKMIVRKALKAYLADRKTEPFDKDTKPQTETKNLNENSNVISVYDGVSEAVRCAMCSNPNKSDRGCDGACSYDEKLYERIMKAIAESIVKDEPQMERSNDAE